MYALSLSNGTGFSREVVRLIHELTPSGLARHFVLKLGHPCLAKNPGFSGPAKSARSFASRPGEMVASKRAPTCDAERLRNCRGCMSVVAWAGGVPIRGGRQPFVP